MVDIQKQERVNFRPLLFLACAVLALAVLLIPFLVRGNHLVWAIMERDGATHEEALETAFDVVTGAKEVKRHG